MIWPTQVACSTANSSGTELRHSGIDAVGEIPWGTHFCQFYRDRHDLIDVLVPYFRAGLENNEFCMWMASEPLGVDQVRAELAQGIEGFSRYLATGQVEIVDCQQWYSGDGRFNPDPLPQAWAQKLDIARAKGFDGLRLTGNRFWLERSDWSAFLKYEGGADSVIGQHPVLALCTYSLDRCGPEEIVDVLATHSFALIRKDSGWEVVESAERKRMRVDLHKTEERYASLFRQMTEGFALHELICDEAGVPCDYRFLEVNPAYEKLMGFSRDHVQGKTMRQVLPDEPPPWLRVYAEVALSGKPVHFDHYIPESQQHYDVVAYRPAPKQFAVLVTDVTERKRVEQTMRESEEKRSFASAAQLERQRFNDILDSLPVAICLLTPDYHLPFANRPYRETFGDPAGQTCHSYIFDRSEPCPNCESLRPLKTGQPHKWFKVLPDGRIMEVYDIPFSDVDGSRLILEMDIDITERNRMEEELRASYASLQQLAAIVEYSDAAIIGWNLDGVITSWNRGAEAVYGYTAQEAVGQSIGLLVPADRAGEIKHILDRVRQGKLVDYHESVRLRKGGQAIPVSLLVSPVRNADGEVIAASVIARDITERKRTEEKLRAASLYARSLLEASLDPLVTISTRGAVMDVNRATELATGLSREELIGSRFSSYFTEPQEAEEGYRKVLDEGMVQDYPLTIRHVSGALTDVLYNATVYRNAAGDVEGVFAAARDVTARKRAEAELVRYRYHLEELVEQRTAALEAATAELARSNSELEQFAYVASHDLQEPLRAVAGYLGMLRKHLGDHLDETSRRHMTGALEGSERMTRLITDLLALSRVGTRDQPFELVALDTALDHALDNLRSSIERAGARITHDPLPALPAHSGQIAQVFQNLIGNAIKFRGDRTPEIHISARRGAGEWILSVRDNGIGIEGQYFERIFLVFQRLHTRRHYPGTGIGLAICKKIVERHGGRIWLESAPGRGTTFLFTLPEREPNECT